MPTERGRVKKKDFEKWLKAYVKAWKSNKPEQITDLFTKNALYSTGPFDEPWKGREAIEAGWIAIGDQPEDWKFDYEVIAVDGDLGVMHGTTVYKSAGTFSNIWLIRLNKDGKAKEFREWFVRKRDN
jgi:ketosteroid isomerase-like protein